MWLVPQGNVDTPVSTSRKVTAKVTFQDASQAFRLGPVLLERLSISESDLLTSELVQLRQEVQDFQGVLVCGAAPSAAATFDLVEVRLTRQAGTTLTGRLMAATVPFRGSELDHASQVAAVPPGC